MGRIGNNPEGPDLTNKAPNTVLDLQDAKGAGDWEKLSAQLREAAKGKGSFGIGSGTRAQADVMGKAWVGNGCKVASD
ncbi:hypothetical protein [Pseudomonas putida]|uniref:hypothetical protein n=1 Tax=Pseudomonas putida TaxID=303 RepID=UPI0023672D01|nr:hypothetical protein [Pseudomonas putida]MDD2050826.1 hypothetical protein [Pseudomonas putida]